MCPAAYRQPHMSCCLLTTTCVLLPADNHMCPAAYRQPHMSCCLQTTTCVLLPTDNHMCPAAYRQPHVSCCLLTTTDRAVAHSGLFLDALHSSELKATRSKWNAFSASERTCERSSNTACILQRACGICVRTYCMEHSHEDNQNV